MLGGKAAAITAGTRVKVRAPMSVPNDSTWDDDKQRTSNSVKKRLQQLFFKGDRRIQAEVVYISSESVREKLKRKQQVKVSLRDPAGSAVVITASVNDLNAA
jgi:hypothetical protein